MNDINTKPLDGRNKKQIISSVNIILGFTQLFEMDDNLTITQKNRLKEIKNSVDQILQVMNQTTEINDESLNFNQSTPNEFLILVVEDNKTNQELLMQQLNMLGYTADVADNGLEALKKIKQTDYKLILTDISMPLIDGYKLTEQIRNHEQGTTQHKIIIAITANALIGEKEKCIQFGMDDYLSKPLNIQDLKILLEKYSTDLPSLHSNSSPELAPKSTNKQTSELIDKSCLIRSLGTDPSKHISVLNSFLKFAPGTINNLLSAYNDRDILQVRFFSHKLKSSSRSIGAVELADTIENIEQAADNNNWEIIDKLAIKIEKLYAEVEVAINREFFT
jgi:two-component system, sensor histidine kinase and response regulator